MQVQQPAGMLGLGYVRISGNIRNIFMQYGGRLSVIIT